MTPRRAAAATASSLVLAVWSLVGVGTAHAQAEAGQAESPRSTWDISRDAGIGLAVFGFGTAGLLALNHPLEAAWTPEYLWLIVGAAAVGTVGGALWGVGAYEAGNGAPNERLRPSVSVTPVVLPHGVGLLAAWRFP